MDELFDDQGIPVKPLTGAETKAVRERLVYDKAIALISARWRKAIIGLAGLVAALSTIGAAMAYALKKFGGG